MTVLVNVRWFKEQITPVGDCCQHNIMKIPSYMQLLLSYLFEVIYLHLQLYTEMKRLFKQESSWGTFNASLTSGNHLIYLWWHTFNDIYHSFTCTYTINISLLGLSWKVLSKISINSFDETIFKSSIIAENFVTLKAYASVYSTQSNNGIPFINRVQNQNESEIKQCKH